MQKVRREGEAMTPGALIDTLYPPMLAALGVGVVDLAVAWIINTIREDGWQEVEQ